MGPGLSQQGGMVWIFLVASGWDGRKKSLSGFKLPGDTEGGGGWGGGVGVGIDQSGC